VFLLFALSGRFFQLERVHPGEKRSLFLSGIFPTLCKLTNLKGYPELSFFFGRVVLVEEQDRQALLTDRFQGGRNPANAHGHARRG